VPGPHTSPPPHSNRGRVGKQLGEPVLGTRIETLPKMTDAVNETLDERYVTAAGNETRTAAAQNKLYDLLAEER
jgi:hypothetical protein